MTGAMTIEDVRAFLEAGQYEAAEAALGALLADDRTAAHERTESAFLLAQLLADSGKQSSAVDLLDRVDELFDDPNERRWFAANVYCLTSDPGRALAELAQVPRTADLSVHARHAERLLRAWLSLQADDSASAVQSFAMSIRELGDELFNEVGPNLTVLAQMMGDAHAKEGAVAFLRGLLAREALNFFVRNEIRSILERN